MWVAYLAGMDNICPIETELEKIFEEENIVTFDEINDSGDDLTLRMYTNTDKLKAAIKKKVLDGVLPESLISQLRLLC